MKRIKYICYYHSLDNKKPRKCVQAATTKIDYTISVLNRIGYTVDIISPAVISNDSFCLSLGGYLKYESNTLRHFPSFGFSNIPPLRYIGRKITTYFFKRWLKKNLKPGEDIIVYHSLGYCTLFNELKRKIDFNIIGEIEEIYQDVHPQSAELSKNEYIFFNLSYKYIFPNTILNEKINKTGKPSIVIHGIYNVQPKLDVSFNDEKIHVIYSGTFDPVKGGALAALNLAKILPNNYHVHVTGFGNSKDTNLVKKRYEEIKNAVTCSLTFHGFISRKELDELMQKCQIGLCTQDPTSKLNLTSFPSKILNYMSNGLVVLSGRNIAIEESAVSDLLYYYEDQTPECMAKAIMEIQNPNSKMGKIRLLELDSEFEKNIQSLLQ